MKTKEFLSKVMSLAWQFVKINGLSMSDAMRLAWRNLKLKAVMQQRIVKFYYQKVSGEIREAYGTLKDNIVPAIHGTGRKANKSLFTYFDTERGEWRSFKKANLQCVLL